MIMFIQQEYRYWRSNECCPVGRKVNKNHNIIILCLFNVKLKCAYRYFRLDRLGQTGHRCPEMGAETYVISVTSILILVSFLYI